jgi:plasmid stabilization system protein ParE
MVGILGDALRSLDEHADRGRPGPRLGLRELALRFGSGGYVLRYQIREGEIVILRVRHSREQRS